MKIRKFRETDAIQVSKCITKAVLGTSTEYYPQKDIDMLAAAYSPSNVKAEFHKRYSLVAVEGSRILGTVGLRGETVVGLFVCPSYAGRKVGTRLINSIERVARKKGLDSVSCNVSIDSVGFYKKCGYRRVRRICIFGVELVRMVKRLD